MLNFLKTWVHCSISKKNRNQKRQIKYASLIDIAILIGLFSIPLYCPTFIATLITLFIISSRFSLKLLKSLIILFYSYSLKNKNLSYTKKSERLKSIAHSTTLFHSNILSIVTFVSFLILLEFNLGLVSKVPINLILALSFSYAFIFSIFINSVFLKKTFIDIFLIILSICLVFLFKDLFFLSSVISIAVTKVYLRYIENNVQSINYNLVQFLYLCFFLVFLILSNIFFNVLV